jgi:hypothetical protein
MFINPINRILNLENNNLHDNLFVIPGGICRNDCEFLDSSSSSDDNVEHYAGKMRRMRRMRNRKDKDISIFNMFSKKGVIMKTKSTNYNINEINVVDCSKTKKDKDLKNVKLYMVFDARRYYNDKEPDKATKIKKSYIVDKIKQKNALILMSGNTEISNFSYSRDTIDPDKIFREKSIPMVAIFNMNPDLKYYEEDSDKPVQNKIELSDDMALSYSLLSRKIICVQNLNKNIIDTKLFYISHKENSKPVLIEITDKDTNMNPYDSTSYIPLSISKDLYDVLSEIKQKVSCFSQKK